MPLASYHRPAIQRPVSGNYVADVTARGLPRGALGGAAFSAPASVRLGWPSWDGLTDTPSFPGVSPPPPEAAGPLYLDGRIVRPPSSHVTIQGGSIRHEAGQGGEFAPARATFLGSAASVLADQSTIRTTGTPTGDPILGGSQSTLFPGVPDSIALTAIALVEQAAAECEDLAGAGNPIEQAAIRFAASAAANPAGALEALRSDLTRICFARGATVPAGGTTVTDTGETPKKKEPPWGWIIGGSLAGLGLLAVLLVALTGKKRRNPAHPARNPRRRRRRRAARRR